MAGLLHHRVQTLAFSLICLLAKKLPSTSTLSEIFLVTRSHVSKLSCLLPLRYVLLPCMSRILLYSLANSHLLCVNPPCQNIFHSLCTTWYETGIVYFGCVAVKNGMLCADKTSREQSYYFNIKKKHQQLTDNSVSYSWVKMCKSVFCHWLTNRLDFTAGPTHAVKKQRIHLRTPLLSQIYLQNTRQPDPGRLHVETTVEVLLFSIN